MKKKLILRVTYTEAKCKCKRGECDWQFSEPCEKAVPLDYLRMALEFTRDVIPKIYITES